MTSNDDITLNDILSLIQLWALIKIQHGPKTIYCGEVDRLDEELDNKYYEMPIWNIGSRSIIYNGLNLSALYIYFRG